MGRLSPEEILEKVKSRITMKKDDKQTIREYNQEPKEVVKNYVESDMNISMPLVLIAYKDNNLSDDKIKKDLSIDMLGTILLGKSSDTFERLYESGKLISEPSMSYEFSKTYSHVMIQFQTNDIEDVTNEITRKIQSVKQNGINEEEFERAKKKIYGEIVKDYNDLSSIATSLVSDYFKNINSLDYFKVVKEINKEYVENVLKEVFIEDQKVVSVVK